ncbi:MAG: tetratricopeptide repeat protein, partial [Chitinophagales bacterium]
AISLKLYGEENPNVATNYNNLGLAWQAKGDLDTAISYEAKSYFIFNKMYGDENNSTQVVKKNLNDMVALNR